MTEWPSPLFVGPRWQMSFGERTALEGLLSQLRPRLSIEIGTAEGGSLERIAAHSEEVHAIDLVRTSPPRPANVVIHVGDSKRVLPELLDRFAAEGRNVDFVLVDGDHSTEGVRADLLNLLSSPAVARTLILLHDTMNEVTREGVRSVSFRDFPKVRHVELDFLTGYMGLQAPFTGQLWGGFGLVVVDESGELPIEGSPDGDPRYYDAHSMIRLLGGTFKSENAGPPGFEPTYSRGETAEDHQIAALSAEVERQRRLLDEYRGLLDSVERSVSWRITAPLRTFKAAFRRRRSAQGPR
jgi:hypothetical protein